MDASKKVLKFRPRKPLTRGISLPVEVENKEQMLQYGSNLMLAYPVRDICAQQDRIPMLTAISMIPKFNVSFV